MRGLFLGFGFCLFVRVWVLALRFVLLFGLRYFYPLRQVGRAFCVCFAACTSVVGDKWRQEAAVRYHAQDGPTGTPLDDVHSHRSSTGFDIPRGKARAVTGP